MINRLTVASASLCVTNHVPEGRDRGHVTYFHFALSKGAKYCNERVCMSVCLSAHTSQKSHVQTSQKYIVTCVRGLVILCTSVFVDDVMFAYNGSYDAWLMGRLLK